MKILILANFGMGLYKFRKELIAELLKRNYFVFISCPKDEYTNKLEVQGCHIINTKVDRRGTNPVSDFKLLLAYLKIIRKVKPDVVLTYTIKPNIYGSFACQIMKIPYINNITGLGSGYYKNSILRYLLSTMYKLSLKKSHRVFFQNKADMQTLISLNIITENYQLIPGSGVNLSEYKYKQYPNEKPLTFIYVGRILKEKGIDEYLEAAKLIKEKYPKTRFDIVGFVEDTQAHYNELLKTFQDNGYVNFYGPQKDVRPFVERAHCLIQPSHGGEGLSNVLLEASAIGRPIIASNIPGCREVIEEGKNGFTFEPKNVNSLVEKIEEFLSLSHEKRRQMGIYSRRKVEKEFNREIVTNIYLKVIENI